MHILVTMKQVHDPDTPQDFLAPSDEGKVAYHSATSFVLNAYDSNAVEEAIRIKEKVGGTVTVVIVGGPDSAGHIRRAIAMGADAGVHVEGPTGLEGDPMAIAALIAAAAAKLAPVDLILCGRQASDTDGGQTHFYLAEALGLPAVSPVVSVTPEASDVLVVHRIGGGGVQRLSVRLPALLGLSNEINRPRAASLKGVMLSKKAVVPTWTAAELGIEAPAAGSTLVAISRVERPVMSAEFIAAESGAELGRGLADRLHLEGYF
jgi:electron transfer flavoprotein beta subunit